MIVRVSVDWLDFTSEIQVC